MSDLRAACIHGRYEKHEIRRFAEDGGGLSEQADCLDYREVTINSTEGLIELDKRYGPETGIGSLTPADLDAAFAAAIGDTR